MVGAGERLPSRAGIFVVAEGCVDFRIRGTQTASRYDHDTMANAGQRPAFCIDIEPGAFDHIISNLRCNTRSA